MALQVDQRVRVSKSVIMNHVPGEKGGPYEMKGAEGVILKDISDGGKSCLSATCPFIVSFDNIGTSERPFKAHFEEHELEAI